MNALEMNEAAMSLAFRFERHPSMRSPIVREVLGHGDPALPIAVRVKIKSETERKRFDALMLLEGVK